MNKKFKRLLRNVPDRYGFISELEQFMVFRIRPFRTFRQNQEFHIDSGDVFEVIMSSEEFKRYLTLFIDDDDESDKFVDVDSDGL